jgi:hypothetical protein
VTANPPRILIAREHVAVVDRGRRGASDTFADELAGLGVHAKTRVVHQIEPSEDGHPVRRDDLWLKDEMVKHVGFFGLIRLQLWDCRSERLRTGTAHPTGDPRPTKATQKSRSQKQPVRVRSVSPIDSTPLTPSSIDLHLPKYTVKPNSCDVFFILSDHLKTAPSNFANIGRGHSRLRIKSPVNRNVTLPYITIGQVGKPSPGLAERESPRKEPQENCRKIRVPANSSGTSADSSAIS